MKAASAGSDPQVGTWLQVPHLGNGPGGALCPLDILGSVWARPGPGLPFSSFQLKPER